VTLARSRPLQKAILQRGPAINFARSASVTFTQMENQLLAARLAADGSAFAKL
jgi:hypothetical protein